MTKFFPYLFSKSRNIQDILNVQNYTVHVTTACYLIYLDYFFICNELDKMIRLC